MSAALVVALVAAACDGAVDDDVDDDTEIGEVPEEDDEEVADVDDVEDADDAEAADRDDDQLVIVMAEEPDSVEPCEGGHSTEGRVLRHNITEPLVSRDPETGDIQPHLASEWEQVEETRWEFNLRDDVDFHNGEHLDAEAVVQSVERLFEPAVECYNDQWLFAEVDVTEVEAVDDYTVAMTTADPDSIFDLRMTFIEITAPETPADAPTDEPIGTGPYELVEWDRGSSITLEAFEDYWDGAPDIGSAEYQWRDESSVRASMVATGEADLGHGIEPADVPEDIEPNTYENMETTYFRADGEIPPLDDVRVREALNLAVDRQAIVDEVFDGLGEPASEMIVPQVLGYNDDLDEWDHDPDRAAELIQEAADDGAPIDEEITLYGRPGFYPNAREVSQIVQAMWVEAGLNINIENLEAGPWHEVINKPYDEGRAPNILQGQHGNSIGDAEFTVLAKFYCDGGQSTTCDEEFDQHVDEALAATSSDEREAAFEDAFARQREAVVQNVPLIHMVGVMLTSERLDYEPDAHSNIQLVINDMSLNG